MAVSVALLAGVAKLFSSLVSAMRDGLLIWLGRKSVQAKTAETEAEARARQDQAAADSPDTAGELIDELRKGRPL